MLRWHFEDPDRIWTRVRLLQPGLSREPLELARSGDGWELEQQRPDVDRIEYQLRAAVG